jgi:hypothetical protein
MIITTVVGIFVRPYDDDTPGPPYVDEDIPMFSIKNFQLIFTTAVFSQVRFASNGLTHQILHHSIPGLVQPVRRKSQLRAIFSSVLTSTCIVYGGLGMPPPSVFTRRHRLCALFWQGRSENRHP